MGAILQYFFRERNDKYNILTIDVCVSNIRATKKIIQKLVDIFFHVENNVLTGTLRSPGLEVCVCVW